MYYFLCREVSTIYVAKCSTIRVFRNSNVGNVSNVGTFFESPQNLAEILQKFKKRSTTLDCVPATCFQYLLLYENMLNIVRVRSSPVGPGALFSVVLNYVGAKSEHITVGSCQKAGPPE